MTRVSELELENLFIERLEQIGYEYVDLHTYQDVLDNFRVQLAKLNAKKLIEAKGEASFSDSEFERVMNHVDKKSVYESAKILRDQWVLTLDNEKTVYLSFFDSIWDNNTFQVAHQITMDPAHRNDVVYKNRYDVTILLNGLPVVQIELKRNGVDINEAINQINRYRSYSFKGLFHFLQLFVVSNSSLTKYFCNENETVNGVPNNILKSLVFFWTDEHNKRINRLEEFTATFFQRAALVEMISKFMVIKTTEPVLMVMRPYQIFAVKAAMKRVIVENKNGYVFACTGSGKTLTSFKLAQLLRDQPRIDKVIFLIDRKDLDDQTVDEYNSFEADSVDGSTSTAVLVKQLKQADRKLIVTTIQKMATAVRSERYRDLMESYRDKKVVFIIDECHRSQFGKMHRDIDRTFRNANYIGFTGTPIFEENKGSARQTTADIFSAGDKLPACLHKYMIKDAIADGNVLRFSVEFENSIKITDVATPGVDPEKLDDPEYCAEHDIDISPLYHAPQRIEKVAEHIFAHHDQHAIQGADTYTSLFAVDSIETLGKYYNVFKALNEQRPEEKRFRLAAIFSYADNEDAPDNPAMYLDPQAETAEGNEQLAPVQKENAQMLLQRIMNDYNQEFNTAYGLDSFDAYRKDISKRMKQKELPQIDILLVVNMMLTGFDARTLNTLYLDKNLAWHSLVQAYSRTNRVDKPTKQFGQIISYRNIKKAQDDALRLFSGDGNPNDCLLESYPEYLEHWIRNVAHVRLVAPTADMALNLQAEDDIREFIVNFRALAGTLATLKTFSQFDWHDLSVAMDEEEFEVYKSAYLYFYDQTRVQDDKKKAPVPVDVDFEIELVRTDRINVMYILGLLKEAKSSKKTAEERERDIDLVKREIERSDNAALRAKKDIIVGFLENVFYELPEDANISEAYEEYEKQMLQHELEAFAQENGLKPEDVQHVFTEHNFRGELSDEDIRKALEPYHLGLLKVIKLIKALKEFVKQESLRFQAEGE